MIKIMQFIHGMNMGGAETLVKDYLLNFDRNKYNLVLLVLEKYDSPYEKLLQNFGIKIIYLEDVAKFKKSNCPFIKIINHFKRYNTIKSIICDEKPDILHIHLQLDSYVKYAKPVKETKIFHTVHSDPKVLWDLNDYKRKKDFKAAKWLVKNYGMKFIVLHEDMRKEINEMFGVNNSIILNNGIDFEKFHNALSKKESRKKLNISENAFVIGHVGRFNKVKNHSFLVDVFYEIYKKNNNSFLLLIGDGTEKENVENKLKSLNLENHYLILSNRSDIPDLLSAMDIFVFPSLVEGLGIALIEAQEMKLPCFISKNVPAAATISNLVTEISLEKSPDYWADKILNYKCPDKTVLDDSKWNIKEIVKELEKIYEEM